MKEGAGGSPPEEASASASASAASASAAADAAREGFRRYLRSSGALDALTRGLVTLYESDPRPPSACTFLGDAMSGGVAEVTRLRAEVASLAAEVDRLRAQLSRLQAAAPPGAAAVTR